MCETAKTRSNPDAIRQSNVAFMNCPQHLEMESYPALTCPFSQSTIGPAKRRLLQYTFEPRRPRVREHHNWPNLIDPNSRSRNLSPIVRSVAGTTFDLSESNGLQQILSTFNLLSLVRLPCSWKATKDPGEITLPCVTDHRWGSGPPGPGRCW